MSAAPSLPPLALERSPSRVIVGGRLVACDWCSLDGRPFVRVVEGSMYPATDSINLCDECAAELAAGIKRALRRRRSKKERTR